MATATRTRSLGSTDQLSADKIHDLIDTLTLTNIARGDAASDTSFDTIAISAPSTPKTGEGWVNTLPASGQIVNEVYDGTNFRPFTIAVLVRNTSGATIPAGSCITIDPDDADTTTDLSIPVNMISVRDSIPIGANLVELTSSGATQIGPAIVVGKVLNLRKNSADSWTIGQGLVPSTTAGVFTTQGAFGQSAIGFVTKNAAGGTTTGQGYLFCTNPSSYSVFRTLGTLLFDSTIPTIGVWSGRFGTPVFFTWPIDNAATKAHMVEVNVEIPSSATLMPFGVFIRSREDAANATFPSLYPFSSGAIVPNLQGLPGVVNRFAAHLMIPHVVSGTATQGEFFVATPASLLTMQLKLYDRGHVVGGAVL